MRYFVFYKEEKIIGKAKTNYQPLIDTWIKDSETDADCVEVSQEVYWKTEAD